MASRRCRACGEEVNPTDRLEIQSSCEIFVAGASHNERPERRVSFAEFQQTGEVPAIESPALDLDGPGAPTAFEHAIHFERFLAPVRDPLPTIPGGRKAGVFNPPAKSRRIALLVRRTIRMHRGHQAVAERDPLWPRRPPAHGPLRAP